jgi:gamma-glutamylputrescine oxidase
MHGQSEIKSVLRKRILEIYPQLHDLEIDYGWECTGVVSAKNVPHMGSIAPNIYFLQGANVAWSILAGKLVSEAVAGQRERFDVLARVKHPAFPIGHGLRAAMGKAAKLAEKLVMAASK